MFIMCLPLLFLFSILFHSFPVSFPLSSPLTSLPSLPVTSVSLLLPLTPLALLHYSPPSFIPSCIFITQSISPINVPQPLRMCVCVCVCACMCVSVCVCVC